LPVYNSPSRTLYRSQVAKKERSVGGQIAEREWQGTPRRFCPRGQDAWALRRAAVSLIMRLHACSGEPRSLPLPPLGRAVRDLRIANARVCRVDVVRGEREFALRKTLEQRPIPMIDLYALTSPNVQKIYIMLEECGLPYKEHFVDVWKGEQYKPEF